MKAENIRLPKEFDEFLFNRWIEKNKYFIKKFLNEKVELSSEMTNPTRLTGGSMVTNLRVTDPRVNFIKQKIYSLNELRTIVNRLENNMPHSTTNNDFYWFDIMEPYFNP